jgi:hypothetical protein
MADNVPISGGSGYSIATDDIGGDHYQKIKPAFGADGSATLVAPDAPLPVGLLERTATGTIAALNGNVELDVTRLSNAAFFISGTFVARFRFEKSVDGTTWEPAYAYVMGQNDINPAALPYDENWANNAFLVACGGVAKVRVVAVGYTSGTINVAIRAETASSHIQMVTPPTSGFVTLFDEFEGAALDTLTWEVANNVGSPTAAVSGSNLTLGTGTASGNKYTLLSRQLFGPAIRAQVFLSLSQRIANQRFRIELVSVDASGVPDEENILGWEFTGTTATTATFRNRAQGGTDQAQAVTIATSATAAMYEIELYETGAYVYQSALNTGRVVGNASYTNFKVPDPNRKYKLRIEIENTAAAGSNTSMVVGFARFGAMVSVPVEIARSTMGAVELNNAVNVAVRNNLVATGPVAHGAAVVAGPVRVGARARTSQNTAVTNDQTVDLIATTQGALTTKPYAIPESDWQAPLTPITTNTSTQVRAAAGAAVRNFVTAIQFINIAAVASEIQVLDGSTIIWRGYAPASMNRMECIEFPTPLKGSVNTAVNVLLVTTGTNTYFNAQGYVGA